MEQLEETKNIVLSSAWTEKNNGGSHLFGKDFT